MDKKELCAKIFEKTFQKCEVPPELIEAYSLVYTASEQNIDNNVLNFINTLKNTYSEDEFKLIGAETTDIENVDPATSETKVKDIETKIPGVKAIYNKDKRKITVVSPAPLTDEQKKLIIGA